MESINSIPVAVSILFVVTLLCTLFLVYRTILDTSLTIKQANAALLGLALWIGLQMALSFTNFYSDSPELNPPKFPLLIGPPLIFILYLFLSNSGRKFIKSLTLRKLTTISLVRIPVEIVLYLLAYYQAIPIIMTFEGANFDILAGISSLFILLFTPRSKEFNRRLLLIWNVISLFLLLTIVVLAVLSAPFSFQQISITQPNWALLFFPYALLPGFIVPAVLFSHLVSLKKLLGKSSAI